MSRFAKLFDLEDGSQVLARLDYNSELKAHEFVCETEHDGIQFLKTFRNTNKSGVKSLFAQMNKEIAQVFRNKVLNEYSLIEK